MNRLSIFIVVAYFMAAAHVYGRVATVSVEQCVTNADMVCICKVEKVEQDTNTVTASLVRSLKGTPELIIVIQGRVYDCKPAPLSAVMKPGERYLVFRGKQNVPRVYVLKIDKDHLVHLGPYTRGFTGVTVEEAGDPLLPINEAVKQIETILAAQNKPTKIAAERAKALKDNLQSFQLQLRYHGPQRKSYYILTLSVLPVPQLASNPFHPIIQIAEDQAAKIIEYLAKDGFLDQATDPRADKTAPPTTPGYTLRVSGNDSIWHAELGWNLAMLKRLDGFHAILDGEAKEAMGLLIGRLSGHRRVWEKAAGDSP